LMARVGDGARPLAKRSESAQFYCLTTIPGRDVVAWVVEPARLGGTGGA
jgi:hypothetical protein